MAQVIDESRRTTPRGAPQPEGLGRPRTDAHPHGRAGRGMQYWPESRFYDGRFGRMFRELDALVLDPGTARGIAQRMVDAPEEPRDGNNPTIPAGYTYLGQFIDHDITFDPASSLQKRNDPDALHNFRTPAFDLDSVYGRGPDDQPYMYDGAGRFLIGRGQGAGELDLPRNDPPDVVDDPGRDMVRRALIGDPRNDENVLVAQLQLTMMLFHNRVMDPLDGLGGNGPVPELETIKARLVGRDPAERFAAAQQIVRWHYQWVVVHDFLRRVVGDETLDAVFEPVERHGRTVRRPRLEHYDPKHAAFMPVEFAVAAYRFGHSMIRNTYRLNTFIPPGGATLSIFNHDADPATPERLSHLGGFRQLPAFWPIEWRFFFDVGDAAPAPPFIQSSRRIDTHLAFELSQLPANVATGIVALAERNLLRGSAMGLPSGQDVADAMGIEPLDDDEIGLDGAAAPLWYYVLREAEVRAEGEHLGPVGGRIVAEVFVGLLANDSASWLRSKPYWTPFLPSQTPGDFTMPDLIRFTGYGLTEITGPGG
ncbi:MAG: heme peroxidase family protein [Acidimicrobiales bacterium]|nr:heme peroxidase family protein [Acidimicrobiales bacterium]